jgi:hypothetical protein
MCTKHAPFCCQAPSSCQLGNLSQLYQTCVGEAVNTVLGGVHFGPTIAPKLVKEHLATNYPPQMRQLTALNLTVWLAPFITIA